MEKRLHHYVEARLYKNQWTASCNSVPGTFGGVSTTSGRLDRAVAQVVSEISDRVGAAPEELTVVVETDPSDEAIAAAPGPAEPYRVRVCASTESNRRYGASLGTRVHYTLPENETDIPSSIARRLADEFWLTAAECRSMIVDVCLHPDVDYLDARNGLNEHAWTVNEPAFAAMKLRYKDRLDAIPAPDELTAWITQKACEVVTDQGNHRYDGPEFSGLASLVAACRRSADLLENADPDVVDRLENLDWRALMADPVNWTPLGTASSTVSVRAAEGPPARRPPTPHSAR